MNDEYLREAHMNISSVTSPDTTTPLAPADLGRIMTLSLSENGMDRMTVSQVEETLACSALTAHF
ncbi:hypothetical protein [Nocardiopsis oceani]